MTKIYLVRHGQSEGNRLEEEGKSPIRIEWREKGPPINQKGRGQSENTRKKLKHVVFHAAYSSDLARAIQTARILLKGQNVKLVQARELREIHMGDQFFQLSPEEKVEKQTLLKTLSYEEMMNFRYTPDCESPAEGLARFVPFLQKLVQKHTDQTILIVNHGHMMRKFLMSIGWTTQAELPDGAIQNAGYVVLESISNTYQVIETYEVKKGGV